ncbi:MAG: hypothetical protein C4K58_06755 [Flavobacteriaceae bacterium]|nr:MAG: hypothetical protein C4K58_06755 [Flavobacteriaceae bacterium]
MKKINNLFLVTVFLFQSCSNVKEKNTIENDLPEKSEISNQIYPSKQNTQIENQNDDEITLGEDKEEINCYVKNIYNRNEIVYIELDFVEIKYENVDERVIINNNSKIRTYIVDSHTSIGTKDCKELNALDMLKYKDSLLKDKTTIVIGESKDGKMLSINFGCYG